MFNNRSNRTLPTILERPHTYSCHRSTNGPQKRPSRSCRRDIRKYRVTVHVNFDYGYWICWYVCSEAGGLMVGVPAWMVSLPSAMAKASFDMAWDVLRDKQDETRTERPVVVEEGIEMHHVNSDDRKNRRSTHNADDKSLTRRSRRQPMEGEETTEEPAATETNRTPPEIISLPAYMKEHLNETKLRPVLDAFVKRFPTFSATLKRLPYALLPFAFSQFILVEALSYTGWINVFSNWLTMVVGFSLPATIFVVGVMTVILCNVSGTNIG